MAVSEIERLLFGARADCVSAGGAVGQHYVYELTIEEDAIRFILMPLETPNESKTVAFKRAELCELRQTSQYPEVIALPWEIRGIMQTPLEDDRWRFLMICEGMRLAWLSEWPEVTSA